MKYAVLAALLATSNANTEPCNDANTGDFDAEKAVYTALTTSLGEKLTAAKALAKTEGELFDTANAKSTKADEIAKPFKEAYEAADAAHKKQQGISDAWGTEKSAVTGAVATAAEALRLATEAQTTCENELKTLNDELTSRKAAVAEALADQTAEDKRFKDGYTDPTATAKAAYQTMIDNYKASIAKIAVDKSQAGLNKDVEDAKQASQTADTNVSNDVAGYNQKYTAMETESVKLEMCKDRKRLIKLPCASADGGTCHADDPVLAAWNAKTCSTSDYDTKKAEWETARRKHTDLQKIAGEKKIAWEVANDALAAEKKVRDDLLATTNPGDMTETQRQTEADGLLQLAKTDTFKNIATVEAKETTAVTVNGVEETPAARAQRFKDQYARALVEQGVTEGKIFDKEKELELKKSEVAAKTITDTEAKAASAAADAKTNQIATDLKILLDLKTKAAAIHDRAQLRVTFYKKYTDEAQAAKTKADNLVTTTEGLITANENNIAAVDEKIKIAIRECKGRGYEEAQAALAAFKVKADENKEAYDQLKKDYDKASAPGTGGAAGTRCEYPKPAADGTQEPRPTCAEELCCGAANRFEKNGTKLTIESCQNAKDTTTYTYYPPLPEGAIVAPRTETWRFSCIGGAQQLAVTASAAVAAIYMMN